MSNGQTRYHAEVKLCVLGKEIRVNVFADTLNEIFADIGTICAQLPGDVSHPGKREILNAELKAEQLHKDGVLPDKVAKKAAPKAPAAPVCVNCGSANTELIKWADKFTGEAKQAWKCQDCKQWLPSAK